MTFGDSKVLTLAGIQMRLDIINKSQYLKSQCLLKIKYETPQNQQLNNFNKFKIANATDCKKHCQMTQYMYKIFGILN